MFADFREIFHTVPYLVPVWEACMLVRALLVDPRSRVAAAVAGWEYPVSREWMLLANIRDEAINLAGVQSASQYHLRRPWRTAGRVKRKPRSVEELHTILKPWESGVAAG